MTSGSADFTPEGYLALIGAFRQRGYAVRRFDGVDPAARHLVLRHDVDFSLTAALEMAEAEARQGIAATYFFLLRTEFYNLLSREGLTALQRIAAVHAIGLHFDATLYGTDLSILDVAAARESDLLAAIIGRPIQLVSYHRPGGARVAEADRLGGRLNVYGARFVREMGYCSDSRGGWHHGHPLEHAAIRAGRALHLLVHPFWWQAPALPPEERLKRFLTERSAFLDRELARHCSIHTATV
jgi:hypothetical protein